MKTLPVFYVLLLLLGGCSSQNTATMLAPNGDVNAVMRPDTRLRGTVRTVNEQGQFVIVDFGLGVPPRLPARMIVYRGSEEIGELKLTGPERNGNVAGDIVSGEPQAGDVAVVDDSSPPAEATE